MSEPTRSHPREREVFLDAVDIVDRGTRENFLDEACGGDAHLRARVEALLSAFREDAEDLLPHAEVGDVIAEIGAGPEVADLAGVVIGPYTLLEELGEGGMGSVWRARQDKPIQREVAIKLIKLGMDTRELVARFEAERQVLAMLDHANIASIYDAGSTESGRPYFVMELVEGVPITDYCDKRGVGISDRLSMFMQVCEAVGHAHQKGVVHRDLKPSNILVSEEGEMTVIDFGIAKITSLDRGDRTMLTLESAIIGTPGYMSPEQASEGCDIDTRADIYSLGALLYELLVGLAPFSAEEMRAAALEEVRRMIREDDPPRPSTRITKVKHEEAVGPIRSASQLRGDLDWIVMQALAKERERRYQTVESLREDVRRHLASEPVSAAAPTWSYRCSKFVRRYRVGVAWAAVALLAIIAGGVLATAQAVRATRAEGKEKAARLEMQWLLADSYTNEGLQAAAKNEFGRSLLWFEEATVLSAGDPKRVQANRMRSRTFGDLAATPLRLFDSHNEHSFLTGLHPNDPYFVFQGGNFRTQRIVDLAQEKLVVPPGMPEQGFTAVGFDPSSQRFATSGQAGEITIRTLPDGKVLKEEDFGAEVGEISNLTWSPDGALLFLGAKAGRIYEVASGKLWPTVLDHQYPEGKDQLVRLAGFSPGNRFLVSVGTFNHWTVKLFQLDPSGRVATTIPVGEDARHAGGSLPAFLGDGRWLVTSRAVGIFIYDCMTGQLLGRFPPGKPLPGNLPADLLAAMQKRPGLRHHLHAAISPVPGMEKAAMIFPGRYFSYEDGSETPTEDHLGPIRGFLGGEYLEPIAVTQHQHYFEAWTLPQDRRHYSVACGDRSLPVFSHDGRLLAAAGPAQFEVRVHELAARAPVGGTLTPGGRVRALDFSPSDDHHLALGLHDNEPKQRSENCRVEIWNWRTGQRILGPLPLDSDPVALRYHPDGEWLAVGTRRGELIRIDVRTGEKKMLFHAEKAHPFDTLMFIEEIGAAGTLVAGCGHGHGQTSTCVLDLATATLRFPLLWHPNRGYRKTYDYRDGILITPGGTHTFCDLVSGEALPSPILASLGDDILSFASEDDMVFASGRLEGARVLNWRTGEEAGPDLLHKFRDSRWIFRTLSIPGTPWVLVCGMHGARFFDPASGQRVAPSIEWTPAKDLWLTPHCVLSPDGRTVAYNHNREIVHVIDLTSVQGEPSKRPDRAFDEIRAGAQWLGGSLRDLKVHEEWIPRWKAYREQAELPPLE